jgi:hypothetical protein
MNEELENLSESDAKIVRMLATLKSVEAPKDFGFRVKARIAAADPRAYRAGSYKRRFAFALTPAAFLVASTFVALNAGFFGDSSSPQNASVAGVTPPPQIINTPQFAPSSQQPQNQFSASSEDQSIASPAPQIADGGFSPAVASNQTAGTRVINVSQSGAKRIFAASANNSARSKTRENKNDLGGGSKLLTREIVNEPIYAAGVGPNNTAVTVQSASPDKGSATRDALSMIGVEVAAGEGGGWKVKSVKQGSKAERAGMKADDVIETLDGRKVSDEPTTPGKVITVKKVGVKRGKDQLEITLQGGGSSSSDPK